MNLRNRIPHRLLLQLGMVLVSAVLAAGCGSVQSYSFQTAPEPDRLPELAFDEVRRGAYADHRDLLGPVQIELSHREIAEFPVILEQGHCYRLLAAAEERTSEIRLALLDEGFVERMAEEGRKGVATLYVCPERTENLLLNIDGVDSRLRVVVAVVQQPE